MSLIDRSSPMPLWAQIESDLRSRISAGAYDERFPTDEELVSTYGVSRQTVRQAVRRLQAEGLIQRERGRGTSVAQPVLEQPLGALYSLALTVTNEGLTERNEILAAERRDAEAWVRDVLDLPVGEPVAFLERLRFAGEEPLSLERSWLPWSSAAGLLEADLERGPLYRALAERCGIQVTSGTERIAPIIPPAPDRHLLMLPPGTAAFLVERIAMAGGQPVEFRRATVRGDRYRFVAEWPSRS